MVTDSNGGKLAFTYAAKWSFGILAVVMSAGIIALVSLALHNQTVIQGMSARMDAIERQLDRMERRVDGHLTPPGES